MNQESELLGADFGQHPNLTGQLQTFQLALIGDGIDRTDALRFNRKAERQNNLPLECDDGAPAAVDACRFDLYIKRSHRRQTIDEFACRLRDGQTGDWSATDAADAADADAAAAISADRRVRRQQPQHRGLVLMRNRMQEILYQPLAYLLVCNPACTVGLHALLRPSHQLPAMHRGLVEGRCNFLVLAIEDFMEQQSRSFVRAQTLK